MSTTVTGKLNKAANIKNLDSGDAIFIIGIGKKEYNRQEKTEVWANYSAALYVKQNQFDYHSRMLVENAIVSISGDGILPRIWQTQSGENRIDLQLVNPRLEYAATGYDAQANQQGMAQAQSAAAPLPTESIPF